MNRIDHAGWLQRAATTPTNGDLFIDGERHPAISGETLAVRSPRDGAEIGRIAAGGAADVDRAVRSAAAAFADRRWAGMAPRERKRILGDWADAIMADRETLGLLDALEVGKPIAEALRVDVPSTAACIAWYAEAIDKTYGQVAPVGDADLAMITREPMGVVGAIVPWNYPLIIAAWKLAPALATGNSVVLKPAEESSLSTLRLAELAVEAGVPPGVFQVVTGRGAEAGAALAEHPAVDKLAFTGSGQTGRSLLVRAGASNGKTVSLELGGKSAHIVLADCADLAAAADAVAAGIFYNAGQTCNAGSRLIVERPVAREFVAAVVERAEGILPGDPLDPATELGTLVSDRHLDRVRGWVDRAVDDGADVLAGGRAVEPVPGGAYHLPTVLAGLGNTAAINREEVFGPVLGVLVVDGADEAVAVANDSPYGLAGGVWTADLATGHRVARDLRVGTVWVNTFDATDVMLPFGGFKASGHGRDKSLHALDAYTHLKTTWIHHG